MKTRFAFMMMFLCFVCLTLASNAQPQQAAPPPVASGVPAMTQPAASSTKITNAHGLGSRRSCLNTLRFRVQARKQRHE
jgi:hypothetical protein